MTIKEFKTLKDGDKIIHCTESVPSVIEGDITKYGFFHRPAGDRGGWDTINEQNCQYYSKAE